MFFRKDSQAWKGNYAKLLEGQGTTMSSCIAPTEARSSEWYNTLTERQRLVLGHAYSNQPQLQFVDLSQSLQREFTSSLPTECSTIIPNSITWSTRLARPLLGPELLKLQGMGEEVIELACTTELVSDQQMCDLAGNAFTGFVFAAVVISALEYVCQGRKSACSSDNGVTESVARVFDL